MVPKMKNKDIKHNKNDKIEKLKKINRKSIKNGSYSIAMTAIFVIAVIVINMIIGELPSKYTEVDISGQKLYSIGDQTKKMLADLKKDVTIYQIAQSGSEDEVIGKLLKKYEDESKHIKVEKKDPVVNPKFVSAYTSDEVSANSLIVVCGDRNKVIDYNSIYESTVDYNTYSYKTTGFDGEGQITSAIGYVTSENLPILYTLEGHGEKELDSTLKDGIEKANMEMKSLNLIAEGSVPKDADCLFINAPASDISENEKNAIVDYLEKGGKAMIFSDYTEEKMDNFDAVLGNYGIERAKGIVFEGDAKHYAMQTPHYIMPDIKGAEAVSDASAAGYYVLTPYSQGIIKKDDVRDSVKIESLLTTSPKAYSKVNLNSKTIEKEADDIAGPFDIGVSVTEDTGDGNETRMVYYSAASLLDSQVNQMVSGGNSQLVLESLKWMADTEDSTAVSVPSKSLEVQNLTLTAYDASYWKICTLIVIPGVFLIIGFVVWLKRRRA